MIRDKNKCLGISSGTPQNSSCTQICSDFDKIVLPQSLIKDHRYYLHSSVRSNLCYSDKKWVIDKSISHINDLLKITQTLPSRVVVHYGKHGTLSFNDGLEKILLNLSKLTIPPNSILDRPLLLENAAGQGTEIGTSIEQMRYILEKCDKSHNIGTCFDTCHAFAFGYDVSNSHVLECIINEIDTFSSIKLIHLNDCKGILGCQVDRHANIGQGYIWSNGMDSLDELFSICSEKKVDMILETPDDLSDYFRLEPFLKLKRRR